MNTKIAFRITLVALCLLGLSACGSTKRSTAGTDDLRWPDFLREWVAEYEIREPQRLAIIDQIDTLYRLIEDSTENTDLLCKKICQTQGIISDAIVHDSSLVFSQMMRATARNLYGQIYNNPWLLKLGCGCEVLEYLFIDSRWYTSSRENFDIMYTTMLGLSWEAPYRFANMVLTKGDDSELATAMLIVYNYADTVIDNLQVSFTDSENAVIDRLTEEDTYVDVPDTGVKRMMMPPYLVMNALASGGTMTISYDTLNGRVEIVGTPQIHFLEQIEDCPRLKAVLQEAQAE